MDLRQLILDNRGRLLIVGFGLAMGGSFLGGRVSVDLVAECKGGVELKVETASVQEVKDDNADLIADGAEGCKIGKVEVNGAVLNPGVYCFSEGLVIDDAVKLAGGLNIDSYAFKYVSQSINFAQELVNGDKVYIPFQDDVVCQKRSSVENPTNAPIISSKDSQSNIVVEPSGEQKNLQDSAYKSFDCISINKGSKEELDTLSGIGQAIAQKIIDGRPYVVIEDLKDVSGIGDSLFTKIKGEICL